MRRGSSSRSRRKTGLSADGSAQRLRMIFKSKKFPDGFVISDQSAYRFLSALGGDGLVIGGDTMAWRVQIIQDSCGLAQT